MPPEPRADRPLPSVATGRVLVIDDSAATREVLAALLRSAGHTVVVAPTGDLGVAFAESHRPEVVVLDLYLPDVDGFTVLRRLRDHLSPHVIVLSAADDEHTRLRAQAAGAARFLVKGVAAPELLAAVSEGVVLARRAPLRLA